MAENDRLMVNIFVSDFKMLKEVIGPNRRWATMERYRAIINHHIAPAIGHVKLAELGASHIHPSMPITSDGTSRLLPSSPSTLSSLAPS